MIKCIPYTNYESLDKYGLQDFFDKTFKYFHKEIILLRTTIFEKQKYYGVLGLIERAWIGVLNNAIIKAYPNDSVTLQEFGVYKEKKLFGRSDMLVRWTDKNEKEFYFLFEAKSYEETNESELYADTKDYFEPIRKQAYEYYDAEKEYYEDKNVFLIPISFGWIRRNGMLEKAKEYYNHAEKKDKSTDFCYLYYEGQEGMWVYGKVFNPKENCL